MNQKPKILFTFYILLGVTKNSHDLLFISRNRCKARFVSEFIIPLAETFAVKIQIIHFLCHTRLNFQPPSSSGRANMSALSFVGKWVFVFSKEIVGIIQSTLKTVAQSLVKMSKSRLLITFRLLKLCTNRTKIIYRDIRTLSLLLTLALLGYFRTVRMKILLVVC